jgi:hypothetical protein
VFEGKGDGTEHNLFGQNSGDFFDKNEKLYNKK